MDTKYDQRVATFWNRESEDWGEKYGRKTSYFYRCKSFHDFFKATGLQQASILDYGCGSGDISFPMLREGHTVLGVDIAADMIDQAARRAAMHGLTSNASYYHLNNEIVHEVWSRKFDVVVCSSVLEYVPDDMALVQMLHSILKDGGFLLCSVPDKQSLFCWLDKWMYAHKALMPRFVPVKKLDYLSIQQHQYDIHEFTKIVEKTGFELVRHKYCTIKLQRGILMEKISNIPHLGMLAIMLFRKRKW